MTNQCVQEVKADFGKTYHSLPVGKLYRAWVAFSNFFWAFIVSLIIVYLVRKSFDYVSWILIATLTILLFIIFRSAHGMNEYRSLPYATYPLPPHLGLDGVSLNTRASY